MSKNGPYSCGILLLIGVSILTPAFAEVEILQTDSDSFFKGDQITFSGMVEKGSNGLVTIVIRDFDGEFVMLTQALIEHDDSFEKTIGTNDKFSKHGIYTATGFILNMTDGDTTDFGMSLNGVPVTVENKVSEIKDKTNSAENDVIELPQNQKTESMAEETGPTSNVADFVDTDRDPQYYVDRYYNEPAYRSWFDTYYPGLTIEDAVGYEDESSSTDGQPIPKESEPAIRIQPVAEETGPTSNVADFVDTDRDPQYYVDRYYNEPAYRSWFDTYYPGLTIEDAVGYEDEIKDLPTTVHGIIDSEIVPKAEASPSSSIAEPTGQPNNNSDIAEISLAVAGLGILFGAVYGIKRKVDDNSKQIFINRETIRKKLIRPIVGSNPLSILQTRLAKGEITLDEYEQLKRKLG